jgi:methylated-DNA-[protein]-cysteine S-methyltransferase
MNPASHFEIEIPSAVGVLRIRANDRALTGVEWGRKAGERRESPLLHEAGRALGEYFKGHLKEFEFPLEPEGTEFQRQVWRELQKIPYGETRSYGELARRIGKPGAARAVGAAAGRNPLGIVIPCHRLIGSAGALTGFAGGLSVKRWLLEHELGMQPLALR